MAQYERSADEEKMREFHTRGAENPFEKVQKTVEIDGQAVVVNFRRQPLEAGFITNYYAPLEPGTSVVEGDIVYQRDVAAPTRDGRTLYADIYRPKDLVDVPVIVAYTPFGKRHWYGQGIAPGLHQAMGVPKGTISTLAAFEAPDPSYWCRNGYAVANIDAAGVGYSEGDFQGMNSQYGRDGADVVEWLAKQEWCNGSVGMAGNSGLAIAQWFVAAECPPSLKCIAPWEGTADFYRESMFPGGIPYAAFAGMIHLSLRGTGLVQDPVEDMKSHPFFDNYWNDYKAKVENIRIPVYVTAGYTHPLHLRGSIQSYLNIRSRQKWMRMHRDFEWPDFNNPKYMADLKLFFDRYLKGIHNGWEMTPRVRLGVTDAYDFDYQVDRPEGEYPLERTQYTKFFLDAAGASLSREPVAREAAIAYDAKTGEANFDLVFADETEITGFTKLRLWVEADGSNDIDLFVYLQKVDDDGTIIPITVFGENDPGAPGKLRVSHRELDADKSKDHLPIHTHAGEQLLSAGEIVPVDIEIWPSSRIWHKGETLRVNVAPRLVRDATWFLPLVYDTRNEGRHIIHTGGRYDSHLLAPVVPPKYQHKEYVHR